MSIKYENNTKIHVDKEVICKNVALKDEVIQMVLETLIASLAQ